LSLELRHCFDIRHSSFDIATMPDSPVIEVIDLVRRFGDRAVIDDISLTIHRGETLVIMGGSGCGKSTLLRHIIGVMKPTAGSVKIFGEEITTMKEREIEKVRRRFGMLFQSGALLASLTVGENVALPLLQHTDMDPEEIEEVVRQKLEMVGLRGFENLKPSEISGGMKKRLTASGPEADVEAIRRRMEDAQARRLQPHYIQAFFAAAFAKLGGRISSREAQTSPRSARTGVGLPSRTKPPTSRGTDSIDRGLTPS